MMDADKRVREIIRSMVLCRISLAEAVLLPEWTST